MTEERKWQWGQLTLLEAVILLALLGGAGWFAARSMHRARVRIQTNELIAALDKYDDAAIKALLHANPRLCNVKGKHGYTPLHRAVESEDKELVALLLVNGADVNATDGRSETPLHCAAAYGNKELVALLLAKGADPNAISGGGCSLAILLAASKDSGLKGKFTGGWTPLHAAAVCKHKEVAKLLLAKGAHPNAKAEDGQTPLHLVAAYGDAVFSIESGRSGASMPEPVQGSAQELVELLLAKGADINAKDNKGQTSLDLAKEQHRGEVIGLLRAHGAKE